MNEETLYHRVLSAVQHFLYGAKFSEHSDDLCTTMPTLGLPHGYGNSGAAETSFLCSSDSTRSNFIGNTLITNHVD